MVVKSGVQMPEIASRECTLRLQEFNDDQLRNMLSIIRSSVSGIPCGDMGC